MGILPKMFSTKKDQIGFINELVDNTKDQLPSHLDRKVNFTKHTLFTYLFWVQATSNSQKIIFE